MTGIVVVSHSRALARAAVALAAEMAGDDQPRVEVAAGLDETTTGTDATAVAEALAAADDGQGVLVLVDLGSALLSAELALDLVDPDLAGRVRVSSAPLVEGLLAAVVAAAAGGSPQDVDREARAGLRGKQAHLGIEPGEYGEGRVSTARPAVADAVEPDASGELVLRDPHGLHARPAARFARLVAAHPDVRVEVTDLDGGRGPADGRSMSALAALGAGDGHRLRVLAWGPGSHQVLAALQDAAAEGFAAGGTAAGGGAPVPGEEDGEEPPDVRQPAPGNGLGAALGPARRVRVSEVDLSGYRAGTVEEELARLERAAAAAGRALRSLARRTRAAVGEDEAAVLEAHLDLLDDPALLTPVREAVAAGQPAPEAWQRQVTAVRERLAELEDSYQRDRARDVSEVGDQVLRRLVAGPDEGAEGGTERDGQRGVLVVDELDVGTATTLDGSQVVGVVTVRGAATGHGVLVARARGFPVVTGAGRRAEVADGTLLALDARGQELHVDPDEATRDRVLRLLETRRQHRERAVAAAREPGGTADGVPVAVGANLGVAAEAGPAVEAGADGCGLLRTEVLFAGWRKAPTVAEQVSALTAVAEALGGRPLTVRTWDVGGDKPLPFLPVPEEANPFLGVRGLRVFRERPGPLLDQLEAVCRVAVTCPMRVMFPMVTTRAEVEWALARLEEAATRLPGGRPERLTVGVMVEVPGAALRVGELADGLDFVSVGSNDLTQYALAAERGNPALGALQDQADPAVLRLVRTVCREVPDHVHVAVCGDAASDPTLAAVLVGLGVRELSATTVTVPEVKAVLRGHRLPELEELAHRAWRLGSAGAVRRLLEPLQD